MRTVRKRTWLAPTLITLARFIGAMDKPSRAAINRAIKTVEFSRRTHLRWLAFYRKYPRERRKYLTTAGGILHHRKAVKAYDQVLFVLRAFR